MTIEIHKHFNMTLVFSEIETISINWNKETNRCQHLKDTRRIRKPNKDTGVLCEHITNEEDRDGISGHDKMDSAGAPAMQWEVNLFHFLTTRIGLPGGMMGMICI